MDKDIKSNHHRFSRINQQFNQCLLKWNCRRYFGNFNDYVIIELIVQNIGGPALFFNNARGLIQNSILRNDTSFEIEYIGNTGYYGLTIEHSNVKGSRLWYNILNGFNINNVIVTETRFFCDSENSNFNYIYNGTPCIGSGTDGEKLGASSKNTVMIQL